MGDRIVLRFHVDIKAKPDEAMEWRDKIIASMNELGLTVKRMPDETRVHVSPPKKAN